MAHNNNLSCSCLSIDNEWHDIESYSYLNMASSFFLKFLLITIGISVLSLGKGHNYDIIINVDIMGTFASCEGATPV